MSRMRTVPMAFLLPCVLLCCQLKSTAAEAQEKAPQTAGTTFAADMLLQYGIITEADLHKSEYITNYEALNILGKAGSGMDIDWDWRPSLSDWYEGETLAPLDHFDDDYKRLLLALRDCSILRTEDFFQAAPDENITSFASLSYIIRIIGDTFSLGEAPEEVNYTARDQVYAAAVKKGLLSGEETADAGQPILRRDFYELLSRAADIEFSCGDVMPETPPERTTVRKILEERKKSAASAQPAAEEPAILRTRIAADCRIQDDLSISWTVPPEYNFIWEDNFVTLLELMAQDQKVDDRYLNLGYFGAYRSGTGPEFLIGELMRVFPERPTHLRVTCRQADGDWRERKEWYFLIELADIETVISGDSIEPGVFTHLPGESAPKSLSLAGDRTFRPDAWYMVTGRQQKYRRPEYNSSAVSIVTVRRKTNTASAEEEEMKFRGAFMYTDDVRLQEITVGRNSQGGLTLSSTPVSEGSFAVVETSG